MDYDTDKVDEMVLAHQFDHVRGSACSARLERARLGCIGPTASEGVYLGPKEQSKVGDHDRAGSSEGSGAICEAFWDGCP
jgi:hypothetical protein